jgi:hypothetical protein
MPADTVTSRRRSLAGRKAALSRSRPNNDPEFVAVSQGLAYEQLAEHAAKVVADWPAPTETQLAKVAAILRAGASLPPDRQAVVAERIAELDGGGDHVA